MHGAMEKEFQKSSGLTSRVEALNEGGRFHLFRYKSYSNIRLVFVPIRLKQIRDRVLRPVA